MGELKVLASIGYHRKLTDGSTERDQAVKKLPSDLSSVGFDYEDRRRAAFAGLVMLGEFEILASAANNSVELAYFKSNASLLRLIAKNWEDLHSRFGSKLPSMLSGREENTGHFLIAGRQSTVGQDDTRESVTVLRRQAQPDQ